MNRTAIAIVLKYISELSKPGRRPQRELLFAHESCTNWAARELLNELRNHPNEPAIDVTERFARKMDYYSTLNTANSVIFSTAHDIAMDILDRLILEKKGWVIGSCTKTR